MLVRLHSVRRRGGAVRLVVLGSALALCLGLAAACAVAPAPGGADAPVPKAKAASGTAPEQSVRPGINSRYLSDDLDVERLTRVFELESREVFAQRGAIVAALELAPGMAVADIGAGTGAFLEPLAGEVGPGGTVFAVEIAPRFLEHLRQRAASRGWSQVHVVRGAEREVPLPEGSLDVAFACDTYHHFEYPASMLASLHRALRPGGMLVVVDFERVPGSSSDWVLEHVRAGREVVAREIEAAGFEPADAPRIEGLRENYLLRFRRP